MSIREKIIEQPRVSGGIAAGLIVLAGVLIFTQLRASSPQVVAAPNTAFYTVDDGETWFTDADPKIVPFTHDGKPAVRAYLYKAESGGAPFVGYLMRYSEAGLAKIARQEKERESTLNGLKSAPGGYNPASGIPIPAVTYDDMTLQEVKRPKAKTEWIARLDPAAIQMANVKASDGSVAVPVNP